MCEPVVDLWADTLGTYLLQGNCPGGGTTVTLATVDTGLVLQGLQENDDIPLVCDDVNATGSNVTAFEITGHDLTLVVLPDGSISLILLQPETLGACSSTLAPQ